MVRGWNQPLAGVPRLHADEDAGGARLNDFAGLSRDRGGVSVRCGRLGPLARLPGRKGARASASSRFDVKPIERGEINVTDDFHQPQKRKSQADAYPIQHRAQEPAHAESLGYVWRLRTADLLLNRVYHLFSTYGVARWRASTGGAAAA